MFKGIGIYLRLMLVPNLSGAFCLCAKFSFHFKGGVHKVVILTLPSVEKGLIREFVVIVCAAELGCFVVLESN